LATGLVNGRGEAGVPQGKAALTLEPESGSGRCYTRGELGFQKKKILA
jgi:hypothetical protein